MLNILFLIQHVFGQSALLIIVLKIYVNDMFYFQTKMYSVCIYL